MASLPEDFSGGGGVGSLEEWRGAMGGGAGWIQPWTVGPRVAESEVALTKVDDQCVLARSSAAARRGENRWVGGGWEKDGERWVGR